MIRGQADNLVSTGLAKAGFRLIFPDDMGFFQRDAATGRLNATTAAFPSGFRALGDYVHGKGLLWGVYSDSGTRTCGPGAGMLGHEEDDAKTFASWGVECDPLLATPPLATAKQVWMLSVISRSTTAPCPTWISRPRFATRRSATR